MLGLNNLNFNWKLRVLMAIAMIALVIFGWVAFSTLREVEVNGPLYQAIATGQSIRADVVPAPVNINSLRIVVYRAIAQTDRAKRQEILDEIPKLRQEFEETYGKDVQRLPEGRAKAVFTGAIHETAQEYFAKVERDLVPALQENNAKRADDVRKELVDIGQKNATAVDELAKVLTEENQGHERAARDTVGSRTSISRKRSVQEIVPRLFKAFAMKFIVSCSVGSVP